MLLVAITVPFATSTVRYTGCFCSRRAMESLPTLFWSSPTTYSSKPFSVIVDFAFSSSKAALFSYWSSLLSS